MNEEQLEDLAIDTVVRMSEIMNDTITINVEHEEWFEVLDDLRDLLIERFTAVQNGN